MPHKQGSFAAGIAIRSLWAPSELTPATAAQEMLRGELDRPTTARPPRALARILQRHGSFKIEHDKRDLAAGRVLLNSMTNPIGLVSKLGSLARLGRANDRGRYLDARDGGGAR